MENEVTFDVFGQFGVLAEPLRARIVRVLAREELAVGELARVLQTSQPTISRHLKQLMGAGFVESRKVGTATWVHAPVDRYTGTLAQLWALLEPTLEGFAADPASVYAADLSRLDAVVNIRTDDSEAFFARLGSRWDALRHEQFGEHWLGALGLSLLDGRGSHIADLGCGTGHLLPLLHQTGATVTGIDREKAMLATAAERTAELQRVHLQTGLLDQLPLSNQSVDIAVCAFVLHHIRHPTPVFADVARVLRPSGRLVVLDMVAHDREDYRRSMGHVHLGFSEASLASLSDSTGLSILRYDPLPQDPAAHGPGLFVAVLVPERTGCP